MQNNNSKNKKQMENGIIASQVEVGNTYFNSSVGYEYLYTIESIRLTKTNRYVFTYTSKQISNETKKELIQKGTSTAIVGHKQAFHGKI